MLDAQGQMRDFLMQMRNCYDAKMNCESSVFVGALVHSWRLVHLGLTSWRFATADMFAAVFRVYLGPKRTVHSLAFMWQSGRCCSTY